MKYKDALVTMILLSLFFGCKSKMEAINSDNLISPKENEQREIMKTILNNERYFDFRKRNQIVLVKELLSKDRLWKSLHMMDRNKNQYVISIVRKIEEREKIKITKATLDSFLALAEVDRTIEINPFTKNALLLSENEIEYVIKSDDWEKFYKIYPDSRGYVRFSNAGFDEDKNSALIYYEASANSLGGIGVLLYLEKKRGEWIIAAESVLWVS